MHPEISQFPSKQFYNGRLIDGQNMAEIRQSPWHASSLLGPYCFFDIKGTQTIGARGHSFINTEELNVALQLYERLRTDYRSINFRGKIGIITPYKAQLRELRIRFQSRYGDGILDEIEFNTTDAFQGRESEIIIFSCVRARASGGIGFLEDVRRMNVGLTRAKSSLWVLGDSRSLVQGEFWSRLVEDAKCRHKYIDGDVMSLLRKPTSKALPSIRQTIVPEIEMSGTDDYNVANSHSLKSESSSSDCIFSKTDEVRFENKEMVIPPVSSGGIGTIDTASRREGFGLKRRRESSPTSDVRIPNKVRN
jgi:senataxin